MTRKFKIGNTVINQESNCFVVAEIGANHMGEVKIAEKMRIFRGAKSRKNQKI